MQHVLLGLGLAVTLAAALLSWLVHRLVVRQGGIPGASAPRGHEEGRFMDGAAPDASQQQREQLERTQRELQETRQALAAARDRIESMRRARSNLSSSLGSTVRASLDTVLGTVQQVLTTRLDACQREAMEQIRQSAQRLLGHANDILDFARVESARLHIEEEVFVLDEVVSRVLEPLRGPAAAKGLTLTHEIRREVPRNLVGDAARLGQILGNFCSNAVKNTPAGQVSLRVQTMAEDAAGVRLRFSVSDTGTGLVRGRLLLQRLEHGDPWIGRSNDGPGLGLALALQLTRLMGGEAGVDSRPGAGSTFWFTVRLQRCAQASTNAASPAGKAQDADPRGPALARPADLHALPVVLPDALRVLEGIDGLDPALGLKHMAGRQAFYFAMLRKFAGSQHDCAERIAQALARDDMGTARHLAHTLKGVCRNVGATRIQQSAAQLEQALFLDVPSAEIQTLVGQTAAALRELLGDLDHRLYAPASNDAG